MYIVYSLIHIIKLLVLAGVRKELRDQYAELKNDVITVYTCIASTLDDMTSTPGDRMPPQPHEQPADQRTIESLAWWQRDGPYPTTPLLIPHVSRCALAHPCAVLTHVLAGHGS